MKTSTVISLKIMAALLLLSMALNGCGQASQQDKDQPKVEKPTIDIHTAIRNGDLDAVKQHIAAGSNLNEKDPFTGSTPIITAAAFNQIKAVEALIDAKVPLTIKNNDGATVLHAAAFFGRIEIVQLLIDANVDKDVRNNVGATARESVSGPFEEVKPIYEMVRQQMAPLGLQIDLTELEKARPVIAMMLQ